MENGAKLYAKNSQSVAPFQLVSDDMSPHILLLQKSIIDNAFAQIVPKQSNLAKTKTNVQNSNSATGNNGQGGSSDPRLFSYGTDLEVSSLTSSAAEGLNQNTFTNKSNFGVVFKRKLQSRNSNNLFSGNSKPKDIYICLDNVSVKSMEMNSVSNNEEEPSDAPQGAGGGCAIQYKKSIAESIAPSIFQHNVTDEHNLVSFEINFRIFICS